MITTHQVIKLYAETEAPYFGRSHAEQDYLFVNLTDIGRAFEKEPSSWGAEGLFWSSDFDDLQYEITQDDTHIVIDYSYIKSEYEGEQERTEGTLAYRYATYTLHGAWRLNQVSA